MNDASTPTDDDVRLVVPDLWFIGGHPTVRDPATRDGNVCLCCGVAGGFHQRRCVRGLVVHLIDPIEIEQHPERWAKNPWVQGRAIDQARAWWLDRAAVITTAPRNHPRFQVCPDCTRARMAAGEIPFTLPPAAVPVIQRK